MSSSHMPGEAADGCADINPPLPSRSLSSDGAPRSPLPLATQVSVLASLWAGDGDRGDAGGAAAAAATLPRCGCSGGGSAGRPHSSAGAQTDRRVRGLVGALPRPAGNLPQPLHPLPTYSGNPRRLHAHPARPAIQAARASNSVKRTSHPRLPPPPPPPHTHPPTHTASLPTHPHRKPAPHSAHSARGAPCISSRVGSGTSGSSAGCGISTLHM